MKHHYHKFIALALMGLASSLVLTLRAQSITGFSVRAFDHHLELSWDPVSTPEVRVFGSRDGGAFTELGTVRAPQRSFVDFVGDFGVTGSYYAQAVDGSGQAGPATATLGATTFRMTDDELLDMVQQTTLRYFYDYGDPNSGMALERNQPGIVTTGGTGFGIMGMIVGAQRGWLTREQVLSRTNKIVDFLLTVPTFRGAFSHWLNGNTGEVVPFSPTDDGGDLVETAFLVQGLLTARQYFGGTAPEEVRLRANVDRIWAGVNWNGYRQPGKEDWLTWHYSDNFGWDIDLPIRGFNEAQIVYILAAAAPNPAYRIPASLYYTGWADAGGVGPEPYVNDECYYGIPLLVGEEKGGPLFFSHYSYLGFDPRGKRDRYVNYFERNTNHTLINYRHCVTNPYGYAGYGPDAWGLTASDDPFGYLAHEPESAVTDNGTITPTAALGSMPYTPERSLAALKHFYRDLGDRLWGPFGFYDAYNPTEDWYAESYLAIDQGPIIGMIENYRSGLLWNLFMSSPEIGPALTALEFVADADPAPAPAPPAVNDRLVLEDFESGTPVLTWDAPDGTFSGAVANPDVGFANPSAFVGAYDKAAGIAYSLFRAQLGTPLDLTTNHQLSLRVNPGAATRLLVKLEGGGQAIERAVDLEAAGAWKTYTFDFSEAACYAGLTDIILFFDPGVAASSDRYYFDDLLLFPGGGCAGDEPDPTIIDDFECQRNAPYGVPGQDDIQVAENPDPRGINPSPLVGRYTDRAGAYHALVIDYAEPIDLTVNPVICLKIWAPRTGTLLFKLEGDGVAYEEAREVTATGEWVEVCVDFRDQVGPAYDKLVLFINAGVEDAAGDVYFLDDLTRREIVGPPDTPEEIDCAGVTRDDTYLDDFECQRNISYTIGGEFLRVIDNPDGSPGSGNTTPKVGAFADQRGPYNALVIDFGEPLDLTTNNQLSVDIWAPIPGNILFKLEGDEPPPQALGKDRGAAPLEFLQAIPATEQWVTYRIDLSAGAGAGYTQMVFFFGAGEDNPSVNTYFFDNVRLTPQPYVADCVANFETEAATPVAGRYFANGSANAAGLVTAANPAPDGINPSSTVGVFTESADGTETYAGLALDLRAPVALAEGNKAVSLKVWMPRAATVALKLEGGNAEPPATGDVVVQYTNAGAWQELTFDLGSAVAGAEYGTISLLLNSTEIPASDQRYYFDDIAVGGAECQNTTGLFAGPHIDRITAFPNPVSRLLTIDPPAAAARLRLTDVFGKSVRELVVRPGQTRVEWDLSGLRRGPYLLTAHDAAGRMLAREKVVRH